MTFRLPLLATILCGSLSCRLWIPSSELPRADPTDSHTDTSPSTDSGDTAISPTCATLLSVEGPLSLGSVWLNRRFYLVFDGAVLPEDLSLTVAPSDGSGAPVELLRYPGEVQGHRVHIVQPPPGGWSSQGEQTLSIRWGSCAHEVPFTVRLPFAAGAVGLLKEQAFQIDPGNGVLFPPGLPLTASDLPTHFLFRSELTWTAPEEPAAVYVAARENSEQHPCSPTYLRDVGPLQYGQQIGLSLRHLPFSVAGSLTKLESGFVEMSVSDNIVAVERVQVTVPAASVTSVDLCDYTPCRVCPSGEECATFWMEAMPAKRVELPFRPPAVDCEDDPDGVCDGFCDGTAR